MKKFYLCAFLALGALTGNAQNARPSMLQEVKSAYDMPERMRVDRFNDYTNRVTIWSSDFTNTSDWTVGNSSTPAYDWEFVTGLSSGLVGQNFAPALNSSSGGQFALIDSDTQGSSALQNAWLQTANPMDMSSYPNVIITWQQYFRHFQDPHYVEVSTDGGTNWTSFLVNDIENSITSANPDSYALNISSAAGGQANVLIRFRYEGNYGWFWAIDDVAVLEQPANDLVNVGSYMSTATTLGLEYGRIGASQLGNDALIGSSVFNFGYTAQTGVEVAINVNDESGSSVYSNTLSGGTIAPNDTLDVEETIAASTFAGLGLYEATYEVTSNEETSGAATFADNMYMRNFEVSVDHYSLDGIGNHPAGYENLTSLGTSSFTGESDGIMFFTMYTINEETTISGIELMVTQSSVAGGSLIVSLHDTANVLADDIASPIFTSEIYDLTAIPTDGIVFVQFATPVTLPVGAYYAGVELFSNANANDIRIVDDLTVPQPWYGSMIYIPSDQTVYSNGEALAIRLVGDFTTGINDRELSNLFSLSPNPFSTEVMLNFSSAVKGSASVNVYGMDGRVALSRTFSTVGSRESLDLSNLTDGLYSINVQTSEGFSTVKVIKAGN
jgi:hypothetical protein